MIQFYGFTKRYERMGIFNLEEILPFIGGAIYVPGIGDVPVTCDRMKLIKGTPGLACVSCKIEGLYFALERSATRIAIQIPGSGRHRYEYQTSVHSHRDNSWHFNLYAMHEDGREELMTKDHIIPKSKRGANKMWNYQLMCQHCNSRKGCKIPLAASAAAGAS